MKFKFSALVLSLVVSSTLISQNSVSNSNGTSKTYACGTEMPPQAWDSWFNSKVSEFNSAVAAGKTQLTSLTIPVIVHVIHGGQSIGGFPNLSSAQIKSQITVLNKDFGATGFNVNQLATKGFSLVGAANCMVTFCLAQNDPNGTPLAEPGIDRINYNSKGWTNPASPTTNAAFKNLIDGTIKPNSIWDPTLYFNVWVTDINSANNLLGYATFPGGSSLTGISNSLGTSTTDGVWCYARSFGNTGNLMPDYDRGRTLTHEVGHWLGLRHIGGDALSATGDCNATDYCDDTPAQRGGYSGGTNGQNFGYPPYPLNANVCSSVYGDMYMNFMDYTYDASKYMFTPDQASRIQTAMANGYYRSQLNASSANLCVGAPAADFAIDSIACMDSEMSVLDLSTGSPVPTYSWSCNPPAGVSFTPSSIAQNPKIIYSGTGTYTISLIITNSVGISSASYEQRAMDCTGLKTITAKLSGVSVFPNPTKGLLTIHSDSNSGIIMHVNIFNSLGQLVISKELPLHASDSVLDLASLPDGVYALSLMMGEEKVSQRLILSR